MDYTFHNRYAVPQRSVADCDPTFANDLAVPVHLQGQTDIGVKEDKAVTLQFKLRAAELVGFECGCEALYDPSSTKDL